MNKIILKTLLAAFVIATSGFAQETDQREQKTVEESASVETETMADRLALTSEQTERIMEINLDFAAKKKEAKERSAPDEEFKLLYQNREDSVRLILNPEQFSSWKENPIAKKIQETAAKPGVIILGENYREK